MKKITTLSIVCLLGTGLVFAQAPKKVIVEDETDVWCGFCPRGTTVANYLVTNYPNVIYLANHVTAIGPDAMANAYSKGIDGALNSSYPAGLVDRMKFPDMSKVPISTNYWESKTIQELNETTPFDVKISSNFNSGTRVLNATVDISYLGDYTAPAGSDLRISCIIVEDGLKGVGTSWSQHNYMGNGCAAPDPNSEWYTYPCEIDSFRHDGVTRYNMAGSTSIWGTAGVLPASGTTGSKYSKSYTYTLPTGWNSNNIRLVAFVSLYNTDATKRPILNANELRNLNGTTTDIQNVYTPANLEVFPNPASDKLNISTHITSNANTNVYITNMMGQVVWSQNYQAKIGPFNQTISLGDFSNGVYFLTMENSGFVSTQKFIVNKAQ